jgi:hypothetical protein
VPQDSQVVEVEHHHPPVCSLPGGRQRLLIQPLRLGIVALSAGDVSKTSERGADPPSLTRFPKKLEAFGEKYPRRRQIARSPRQRSSSYECLGAHGAAWAMAYQASGRLLLLVFCYRQ